MTIIVVELVRIELTYLDKITDYSANHSKFVKLPDCSAPRSQSRAKPNPLSSRSRDSPVDCLPRSDLRIGVEPKTKNEIGYYILSHKRSIEQQIITNITTHIIAISQV